MSGCYLGFGALMQFSGFMLLLSMGWAGRKVIPGLDGWAAEDRSVEMSLSMGQGQVVQLSFPPAAAQFPSVLPTGPEGRLVRGREGLADPAGRVHTG